MSLCGSSAMPSCLPPTCSCQYSNRVLSIALRWGNNMHESFASAAFENTVTIRLTSLVQNNQTTARNTISIDMNIRPKNLMKSVSLLSTILCVTGAITLLTACASARNDGSNSRSAPLVQVLEAAKNNDMESFFSSYSERVGNRGSARDFQESQGNLKSWFGDYVLSDFQFRFEGTESKGVLIIIFQGKEEDMKWPVLKEGTEWKLDRH